MSEDVSGKLVDLLVVALLIGALLGTIVGQFNDIASDTGNFTGTQIAILTILGILVCIGVLYMVLRITGLKKGK